MQEKNAKKNNFFLLKKRLTSQFFYVIIKYAPDGLIFECYVITLHPKKNEIKCN